MSMDTAVMERILELCREYERVYGCEPDLTLRPAGITQETLVRALELMIQNNDSLVSAYGKIRRGES